MYIIYLFMYSLIIYMIYLFLYYLLYIHIFIMYVFIYLLYILFIYLFIDSFLLRMQIASLKNISSVIMEMRNLEIVLLSCGKTEY
jgi:hypothetical protein